MYFVDTHCHLDLLQDIGKKAVEEDLLPIKTITVTNSPSFFEANQRLFKNSKNIRVALGLHPELVPQFHQTVEIFERQLSEVKFVGELGLDGSREHSANFLMQENIFKRLISIIKSADHKILSIHSRSAVKKTIDILKNDLSNTNCKIILHWFSGSLNEMKTACDLGYYFSINHRMLDSKRGKELIQKFPLDKILTETDAPFTFNSEIADRLTSLNAAVAGIAELRQLNFMETKELIYCNFKNLLTQ